MERTGAVCRDALFPLEKEDTKPSGKGVWGVDSPRCPLRFLLRRFEKTGETLNSFHNHSQAGWFAKTASPLSTKLHPPSIFHLACLQDLNPVQPGHKGVRGACKIRPGQRDDRR